MDQVPTFQEIFRVAPITTIILIVIGVGYYYGFRARDETVETLREWLDELRKR